MVTTAVALLAGCGPESAPRELRLGATLPLSGRDSAIGRIIEHGYRRAVEEVNARGGVVLGPWTRPVPVVLEIRDDLGETPEAERLAAELIAGGVHALLATASDVRAAAQALVADRAGCPYLVNAVDAPGLPGRRARWVFRVAADGPLDARARRTAEVALQAFEQVGRADRLAVPVAFADGWPSR